MAQYQSNAAYDFELFERKPQTQHTQPALKVVTEPKARRRNRMMVFRSVCTVAVVVSVVCVMLYSRAKLTGLVADIDAQQDAYSLLLSENTRLKAEYESKVSLRGIEESAQELGMTKVQPYQVQYVPMTQDESITLTAEGSELTFSEKLDQRIQSLLEYIRIR